MQIYLIAAIKDQYHTTLKYRVLDIDSEELREVSKIDLINAIRKNEWAFKNVSIKEHKHALYVHSTENYELTMPEGIGELPMMESTGRLVSRNRYILISIDEVEDTVKLAEFNGTLVDIEINDIYDMKKEVAGIPLKYRNKPEVNRASSAEKTRFKEDIAKQYDSFIVMTKALGLNCSFVYMIVGNTVTLGSYTGSSLHAIVPKFVTNIGHRAFYKRNITDISLNDGLKVIGTKAFASNNINEIDIPKTVLGIGSLAFRGNKKLLDRIEEKDGSHTYVPNKNTFRIYNEDTKILQQ